MWPFRRSPPACAAISPDELEAARSRGAPVRILDVRTPAEFAGGHIPGAINIPHTELRSRGLNEIGGTDQRIVVTCASGGRARTAAAILRELGCRDVVLLDGHMNRWCAEGRPLARGPAG